MSQSLGPALPADLLARLSQKNLTAHLGKAVPLITVDAEGRPHPMLLSYVELRAVDPRTIRLVIGAGSRSAKNLVERRVASLLWVEPEQTIYVKARLQDGPHRVEDSADLGLFELRVEDVLEDTPGGAEEGIRIHAGISYAPVLSLKEPRAQVTLRALAQGPGS